MLDDSNAFPHATPSISVGHTWSGILNVAFSRCGNRKHSAGHLGAKKDGGVFAAKVGWLCADRTGRRGPCGTKRAVSLLVGMSFNRKTPLSLRKHGGGHLGAKKVGGCFFAARFNPKSHVRLSGLFHCLFSSLLFFFRSMVHHGGGGFGGGGHHSSGGGFSHHGGGGFRHHNSGHRHYGGGGRSWSSGWGPTWYYGYWPWAPR